MGRSATPHYRCPFGCTPPNESYSYRCNYAFWQHLMKHLRDGEIEVEPVWDKRQRRMRYYTTDLASAARREIRSMSVSDNY